jgi:segregation and condensation protein B
VFRCGGTTHTCGHSTQHFNLGSYNEGRSRPDFELDMTTSPALTLTVREAAELLGRDRTRVYALVRSGDLVAVPGTEADDENLLRIDRSSVERWALAGGSRGGPLTPRNAWAIIGLASGDEALSKHCLGLLERREEVSRIRARLARDGLLELAPRLRRRASLNVVRVPSALFIELEADASLVRTGTSAAVPYGWDELVSSEAAWALDAYLPHSALQVLLDQVAGAVGDELKRPVLLRTIDGVWPFPANCQLAPQPLAALDLLDYPDPPVRNRGRQVLRELAGLQPTTIARRTARARTVHGPLVGKALGAAHGRGPRPVVEGDPLTDTRAAAAHVVGVLWAAASQGATVSELRAAIGLTRERLEDAYTYLLNNPPLGQSVQRHKDELFLVSAPEVAHSIERHLGHPRPVPLSRAATEVLAIVAYKQPIARAGVDFTRGTSSQSALDSLLVRGLVAVDQHHLLVTTRAFLDFAGLRDLADLTPQDELAADARAQDSASVATNKRDDVGESWRT